jgi:hypothetical protein
MARDLIPPPSPAGRPAPDPEPHGDPVANAAAATESRTDGDPSGPAPFRARFGFMTGILLGCVVAAALLAATVITTNKGPEEGLAANWSPWKPKSSDPLSGAEEIAAHISRQYKADGKKGQLVSVKGGPIAFGGLPLSVAVQPAGGDIQVLNGIGIQYTLSGLGDGGVIKNEKPSKARDRLLRREALELSLYSFRYLPDVSMVVTLLPPDKKKAAAKKAAAGKKAGKHKAKPQATVDPALAAATGDTPQLQHKAIFYRPGDLRPQLEVPLNATLNLKTPPLKALSDDGEEVQRVDSLTRSNLFDISYARAQDATAYLVLERKR